MARGRLYPRFAEARLVEALADTPVVLIHGPRQSGKTTLARLAGKPRRFAYFSFDDDVALAGAKADPIGFVADLPERAILDEVQRAPELFPALKMAVDRRRTNGRFLLTGSANVLLVPKLAESLAGRMGDPSASPARSMRAFSPQAAISRYALRARLQDEHLRTTWFLSRRPRRLRRLPGGARPCDAAPSGCLVPRLHRDARPTRRARFWRASDRSTRSRGSSRSPLGRRHAF